MRPFFHYLILFFTLLAVSGLAIPRWFGIDFPRQPGPVFNDQIRKTYITRLDSERPEIVLLGDSTLKDGVDPDLLSSLLGRKVSRFDVPGSASAFWYLVLKNNIVVAKHPPKYVIIIF